MQKAGYLLLTAPNFLVECKEPVSIIRKTWIGGGGCGGCTELVRNVLLHISIHVQSHSLHVTRSFASFRMYRTFVHLIDISYITSYY